MFLLKETRWERQGGKTEVGRGRRRPRKRARKEGSKEEQDEEESKIRGKKQMGRKMQSWTRERDGWGEAETDGDKGTKEME